MTKTEEDKNEIIDEKMIEHSREMAMLEKYSTHKVYLSQCESSTREEQLKRQFLSRFDRRTLVNERTYLRFILDQGAYEYDAAEYARICSRIDEIDSLVYLIDKIKKEALAQ